MPSRSGKWLTILWALLLGSGVIALAGSVLLPSTKRARVDWEHVRRMREQEELAAAAAAAETRPATLPSEMNGEAEPVGPSAEPSNAPAPRE